MKTSLLLACLWPVASWAQTSPEGMMLDGLQRLATQDTLMVETTGTELRGDRVVSVKVSVGLVYKVFDNDVKVEVMTFEDGKIVSRQAGDGTTLWDFDVRSNSYSSSSYASAENGLAANWKQRFFHTLRLRTTGVTSFTFRLLDEAFGTGVADGRWLPWIPTAQVAREDTTVVCKAETPGRNELTYFFNGSDSDGFTLTGAAYEQYRAGGNTVVRHWDMTVTPGVLPEKTEFGFVPPRGAKMISIEQHLGGN